MPNFQTAVLKKLHFILDIQNKSLKKSATNFPKVCIALFLVTFFDSVLIWSNTVIYLLWKCTDKTLWFIFAESVLIQHCDLASLTVYWSDPTLWFIFLYSVLIQHCDLSSWTVYLSDPTQWFIFLYSVLIWFNTVIYLLWL